MTISTAPDERKFSGPPITWDFYAMKLAEVAALKSKDPWERVGCCLLRPDNSVAALGYNGFIAGMKEDWSDRDERRPYIVHAEANALRYIKPGECTLAASTLFPCNDCLKNLASYGIKTIVYQRKYDRHLGGLSMAEKLGIKIIQIL